MSDEAALLAAIHANPDDDTPRLVYADWLDEHGDPARAEFIRVQIELASLATSSKDGQSLLAREGELLIAYRAQWAAEVGIVDDGENCKTEFRRGLLVGLSLYNNAVSELETVTRVPGLRRVNLGRGTLTPAGVRTLAALDLDSLMICDMHFPNEWLELLAPLPCGTVLNISVSSISYDWNNFQSRRIGRFTQLSSEERYSQARRWQRGHNERRNCSRGSKVVFITDVQACDVEMQLLAELRDVEEVYVSGGDLTSAGVAQIAKLPNLKRLYLSRVPVESIAPLARCATLEALEVQQEPEIGLGDAGTEVLEQFVNLRYLFLRYGTGDRALARLGALCKLSTLSIELRGVDSEESFASLSHLVELKCLWIDGAIPGGALQFLAPLRKLQSVILRVSTGGATDFLSFGVLTELRLLCIEGDAVTDAAIQHFVSLKNLRTLEARDTQITPEGARWLAAQLPEVTIILPEHVIKSPRPAVTFRRHPAESSTAASAMLPTHWTSCRRNSHDDPCRPLVEDGWEKFSGSTFDLVGPAEIRMYAREGHDSVRAMNAIVQRNPQLQSSVDERDVVELNGGGASCVYRSGKNRSLVVVTACEGKCVVLQCEAPASRFEEFRPLFLFVARSLRVGEAAREGVGEEVTVAVSEL